MLRIFHLPPLCPDRLWGPPSLLPKGQRGGGLFPRVNRPGREADHSPSSSDEVKNAWNYTFTPPYVFVSWCLVKYKMSSWRDIQLSTEKILPYTNLFQIKILGLQDLYFILRTSAVWKVRGVAVVHRCYAERGGDCCAKFSGGDNVVVAWSSSL
jgi:hypothetical protein